MKAVFDTKPGSGYDDEITQRYHFPSRYANIAATAVNDWVVFRRPRADGGDLSYFAVAKVLRIDDDTVTSGRHYARLSDYLPFDKPVPWSDRGRYAEEALRALPQVQVGVYLRGRSMRPLQDGDFVEIVKRGLSDTIDPTNAKRYDLPGSDDIVIALQDINVSTDSALVEKALVSRVIRNASFRRNVCLAYQDRCAITGLRIINGGGRAEVQAAHIWPVAEGGPDVVQNGIALSGTIHWLFDRHLVSLRDDYTLLIAHNRIPVELHALFAKQSEQVNLPVDRRDWPHPNFIARHRERFAGLA